MMSKTSVNLAFDKSSFELPTTENVAFGWQYGQLIVRNVNMRLVAALPYRRCCCGVDHF